MTARAHLAMTAIARSFRDARVSARRVGVWARREALPLGRGDSALGLDETEMSREGPTGARTHTAGSFPFGAVLFGHVNRMFSYGFGSKR